MIFAFAPISALLLGVSDITVPWSTLLLSVVLYVLLPLLAGVWTRDAYLPLKSLKNVDDLLLRRKSNPGPSLAFWPLWYCSLAFRRKPF